MSDAHLSPWLLVGKIYRDYVYPVGRNVPKMGKELPFLDGNWEHIKTFMDSRDDCLDAPVVMPAGGCKRTDIGEQITFTR